MDEAWIKSPTARRVLVHWADARPAWLWSHDGETLLWRNEAARLFRSKIKKHGIKLAPEAVPIKGQIARLIRLGAIGRSSLSRIQFLAGERPVSTTCSCTPLEVAGGDVALLIVGVDPIEPELLAASENEPQDSVALSLFPRGSEYLLVSDDSQVAAGSARALESFAPVIESEGLPPLGDDGSGEIEIDGEALLLTRLRASQHDAMLLLFEPAAPTISDIRAEEDAGPDAPVHRPVDETREPLLPMGLEPLADSQSPVPAEDAWGDPIPASMGGPSLSSLFDRLAGDVDLYTPLTAADEHLRAPSPAPMAGQSSNEAPPDTSASGEEPEPDPIGGLIRAAEAEAADAELAEWTNEAVVDGGAPLHAPSAPDTESQAGSLDTVRWRIVGRGFIPGSTLGVPASEPIMAPQEDSGADEPLVAESSGPSTTSYREETVEAPDADEASSARDADSIERVSRYNFDELSRILTDRVSGIGGPRVAPDTAQTVGAAPAGSGAMVNLAGETFILNRLPLGILVFRDQQVLFANRALVELAGYESIEGLRAAGLTSIFPAEGIVASPVTHMLARDGTLLPVNARLQSISWHGRPALMLSASRAETRSAHEFAVRTFAELAAGLRDDGFIACDRSGLVTAVSLHTRAILGKDEHDLIGLPLSALVDAGGHSELRAFFERPARFAETARPGIVLKAADPGVDLTLFAEGQAGIVSGYFGFLRRSGAAVPPPSIRSADTPFDDVEPSMLVRISRGIRRPLNTIVGFAELIGSAAFGPGETTRYAEYARDIGTAGLEIATLVDEIDEYAHLNEGRFTARTDEVELAALLETTVLRVMPQATARRVLVRSAISERLPRIAADALSLTQAVLNLLASAIEQTPVGGSVILSAQVEDDGAITINIRDSAQTRGDLGERFVVFRDGTGRDGEVLRPVRSSVGLALTRSLLAVNALSLSVDPTTGAGTLFSLSIPSDLVTER